MPGLGGYVEASYSLPLFPLGLWSFRETQSRRAKASVAIVAHVNVNATYSGEAGTVVLLFRIFFDSKELNMSEKVRLPPQ